MASSKRNVRWIAAVVVLAGAATAAALWLRQPAAKPAGPPAATPTDPPEGLLAQASLGGGRSLLGTLRDRLGSSRIRLLVPRSPGMLLDRLVGLPAGVGDRIADDEALHLVVLRDPDDEDEDEGAPSPRLVAAARVHSSGNEGPLGPAVELRDGGPLGGQWVGAPGSGDARALLVGDLLIAARHERDVRRAAAYLRWIDHEAHDEPGLVVTLPDGIVADPLHRHAERALSTRVREALAQARAERARRDAPPDFGEPEEVIGVLRDALQGAIAWLPDVGRVEARLAPGRSTLELDVRVAVREQTPLRRKLQAMPVGRAERLGALPPDTAFAWMHRTAAEPQARSAGETGAAATLQRVAGDRMDDGARARVDDGLAAVAKAAGPSRLVAIGMGDRQPWAIYAAPQAASELDTAAVLDALAAPWLADVAGALLGCDSALRPRRLRMVDRGPIRRGSVPLCRGEGDPWSPHLEAADAPGAFALAIVQARSEADADASVSATLVRRLAASRTDGGLGADPNVQRALHALGKGVLSAAVVSPPRLLPAAGLLGIDPLRRAAEQVQPGRAASPVVLGVVRRPDGVGLRLTLTPDTVDELVGVVLPWLDL